MPLIAHLQVVGTHQWQESQRISLFLSMSDEINTEQLLHQAFAAKKDLFIPRYIGSNMDMVLLKSWQDYESLPLTSWNIRQPADDEDREDALKTGSALEPFKMLSCMLRPLRSCCFKVHSSHCIA